MKKKLFSFIYLILALLISLPSCSAPLTSTEEEKTAETSEGTNETKTSETSEKEDTPSIMQKSDPKEDDTLNLLMIGNSGCYYYVEELYAIAKAAGVKMKVCNLYYSGCKLEQHWEWLRGNENKYEYVFTDENGRRSKKNVSLKTALKQENWDFISLQQGSSVFFGDYDAGMQKTKGYAKNLFDYLKKEFPLSQFYWHQTWAYQVGYDRSNGKVENKEQQDAIHEKLRRMSSFIASENNATLIPSGDAWYLARRNPVVGDNLCARLGVKDDKGDNFHDGDIGGGQYLNACVWFEVLTGKSCIENTWRPDYDLSNEKIIELQKAAHEAVAALYGADYAK